MAQGNTDTATPHIPPRPETPAYGHEVFCDGGDEALGHPGVWMALVDGRAVCPYCSRLFVAEAPGAGTH